MHVHETLASRGLAYEGLFSSLVSQVAVLKSEVLVIDTGIKFFLSHPVYHLLCYLAVLNLLIVIVIVLCLFDVNICTSFVLG